MSVSLEEKAPVPRRFLEDLGFELPEEAFSFYLDGSQIVFNVQDVEEIGCNFRVCVLEEKFPLSEEQLKKLKDAHYDSPEGFLIL